MTWWAILIRWVARGMTDEEIRERFEVDGADLRELLAPVIAYQRKYLRGLCSPAELRVVKRYHKAGGALTQISRMMYWAPNDAAKVRRILKRQGDILRVAKRSRGIGYVDNGIVPASEPSDQSIIECLGDRLLIALERKNAR